MFTGIIEAFGKVVNLEKDQENLHLSLESRLTQELKIDQSLAHNGVCLTVVETLGCLLYTSPSPRDLSTSRMPSSA